ncbi:DUF421 domain-containing protein [Pseudonocardia nigra]|uniref:DUF421 domain-containing protein n=1 Tax=Pseudonocardia nigra TaxID=1921578 RepID=UPI001C5E0FD5|nr:YetF domain-containing protein [Pseudonocardia nigra]
MNAIFGDAGLLGSVAAKAALLYLTAVVGFRVAARRSLADMSPFDFVAAVAIGSIVGRVPNASDAGYAAGAVTLVVVLIAHAITARLRHFRPVSALIDHEPRLLVAHGELLQQQVRRSGLTRADIEGLLRERGIGSISQVRYVILEQHGRFSVLREDGTPAGADDLVAPVVAKAGVPPDGEHSPARA